MATRTSGGVYSRRVLALGRLEHQLETGVKIVKAPELRSKRVEIPLTEKDIARINKEIQTLKSRI